MFGVDLFFAGLLDAGRPARRAAGVRRAALQQVLRSPHARALRTLASASRSLIARFPLAFHSHSTRFPLRDRRCTSYQSPLDT